MNISTCVSTCVHLCPFICCHLQHSARVYSVCLWRRQAEEQLRRVELERQQLEERQKREDDEKKRSILQQEVILNKKKARPKLSFSLGAR